MPSRFGPPSQRCRQALIRLALALSCLGAQALGPAKAITQYLHTVWQTEQGLPQNTVQALCQTRDGYLWLGTQEGLVRFDGVRFTVFNKNTTPELKQNFITALCEDPEGGLWIGVREGGLVRWKEGRFTPIALKDGSSEGRIRTIHVDRAGNLWLGTSGGGLRRYSHGSFRDFTTRNGLSSDQILSLCDGPDGALWIGTFGGGLDRYQDGRFTAYTTKDGLPNDQVSCLCPDRAGNLWIGTFGGGICRFKDGRFTPFTTAQGLTSNQVWTLCEDREGSLWIGTDGGGLDRFQDGRFSAFTSKQGLSNDVVQALREDREGNLWIGTAGGGLNRLRDSKFTPFTTREGLSDNVVLTVFEDHAGSLWFGTDGSGLNRLKDGRFTAFTSKQGLSNDHVTSLCEDREGNLWVGTLGGGLNRFRDGRFTVFTTRQGLSSNDVVSLFCDREGRVWAGTDGGGLNRYSGGIFTVFTAKEGLSNEHVISLLEDRAGNLWIGTSGGGLNCLREGRITAFTRKDGLSDDRIAALYEDAEGALWIGTSGGGLDRYWRGRFTAITTKEGLFDDRVFTIQEDGQRRLWMSCNRGVFRADKQDLEAFAEGRASRVACVAYGLDDGLRSPECNGENQPAGWKARDGRLWFPTLKGAAVIDPARILVNLLPPPVRIEEVLVDGKALQAGAGPSQRVEAGSRKFDFHYAALSFVAPAEIRFMYRLEGFDKDWVEGGSERTAHYTSLPPGDYRFRVKACNEDGVWSAADAGFEFGLQPFFYQTRAFLALCGLGLILSGAGAQRLRIRRLKKRQEELERIVEEQTHDLRAANEELHQAQEQLAKLSEASPSKVENVSLWGSTMADQIGRAIHARRVHVWRVVGEELLQVSTGAARPPSWADLEAARNGEFRSADGAMIVRVTGMTGELRGALVIEGLVAWGDTERHLILGLAEHLGSALDLQQLREQLTATEERQAAARLRMQERGIHTLKICGRCGRCYDETTERCVEDGQRLDGSRLLPYRVLDRYRLDCLLGEGGMGTVFEARDEKLDRDVALKVLRVETLRDPEARFRMEREAKTLAQFHHPSVTALYDSGELEDGSAFLVMELLAGRDLAALLNRHGAGTPAQVATLLRQVGSALKAAHRIGVIHRDIKPANIFLVPEKEGFLSKVLDFGLAKSNRAESLTQTGVVMGTAAYMSPEQVQGLDLDERTDLYSLAAVGYEALTGRHVVAGHDLGRMMVDVLYTVPPRISTLVPGLPPEVDAAFEQALAKQREERPMDIEAWSASLAAHLDAFPSGDAEGWALDLLDGARRTGMAPEQGDDTTPLKGTSKYESGAEPSEA